MGLLIKMNKSEKKENLIHEGGDEAAEPTGKKTKQERYADQAASFSCLASGMNEETGINFDRGCTDLICLVLFLSFIATMFGVSIWCVSQGNPGMLINPYDFE